MTKPTIHTDRLTLRPFSLADVRPLHVILSEPNILQYFPYPDPPDIKRVENIIKHQLIQWEKYGTGWWAVVPKGQAAVIGWNGLQYLTETGETEVGYLLSKPFWGLGYATEGAQAALIYGFEQLNLQEIIGLTHPENKASQNVLKKCGMHYTGQKEYFGIHLLRFSMSTTIPKSL